MSKNQHLKTIKETYKTVKEMRIEMDLLIEKETSPNCHRCLEYKKGDCAGSFYQGICEDYRHTPEMTESDRENWPTACLGAYGGYYSRHNDYENDYN